MPQRFFGLGLGVVLRVFSFGLPAVADTGYSLQAANECLSTQRQIVEEQALGEFPTQAVVGVSNPVHLCWENGRQEPELARAWPSRISRTEISHVFGESSEAFALTTRAANTAYEALSQFLGSDLPLTVYIGIVDLRYPSDRRGVDDQIQLALIERCQQLTRPVSIFGFAIGNFVVVCIGAEYLPSTDSLSAFEATLIHELFHSYQYQAVGAPNFADEGLTNLDVFGPAWFVEGSANFFEQAYYSGRASTDSCRAGSIQHYMRPFANDVPTIAVLEHQWPDSLPPRRTMALYQLSYFLVCDLQDRAGSDALLDYYTELGSTGDWHEAFERAFGFSIDAFYSSIGFTDERPD